MRKTTQDNNMTDQIGAVCTEKKKTELLWLIKSGSVYDKNQQENSMTNHNGAVYIKNYNQILWPIGLGVDYDKNKIGQLCNWSYRWGLCRKWN